MMKYMPHITMYIGGVSFGFGLAYSGAAKPEVVLSFLNLQDLGLILVIGTALALVFLVFTLIPIVFTKPPFGTFYDVHDGFLVTRRAVVGAIIFGIGWGLSGLCPATSLAALGMGNMPILYGMAGIFLGALIYGTIRSKGEKE